MAIDDEADFETAAYPAGEFVAGTRTTHEVTPGAPVDLAGMKSASQPCAAETPEKPMASLAGDEKTAHDVKSPKVSGEHFEVEIPVEAIMRHAAAEEHAKVTSAPASGAPVSPEKAETLTEALPDEFNKPVPDDARATGSVKMKKPAPPEEHGRAAVEDPVEFNYDNEEHGSAAVGEAFELNYGREEDGQDGEEHASFAGSGSRFAPEARPEGLERALSPVSFEKLIEGPAKEGSSQTARLSPTAAEVHEKVQAGIKVSVDSGGGEVRMKLNPESLGEVRIKLNVDSGVVKAEIMVENMEVKRIIESDSSFLKESLGAHGLTLDKCVVEVSRSFDARGREGNGSDAPAGGEQRPPRDREQEKSGTPWQRHYKQGHGRQEDGRLDFFI